MYQLIFRDVRVAALWVIGVVASVALFFSEGGGQRKLAQAAQEIESGKNHKAAATPAAVVTLPAEPSERAATADDDADVEPGIEVDTSDQSYSPGEASAGEIVEGE